MTVGGTLILVSSLHALAWWLLNTPKQETDIRHTQPGRQPLVVSLIAPLRPIMAPKATNARAAENRRPLQRPAQPVRTAPPRPARLPPSATDHFDEPPHSATSAAVAPTVNWQSARGEIGTARSYRYGSNAERATAAMGAGSASLPPAPTQSEFERQTAKAAKADCREAHANMGLLALPMLAYDALDDSGCRW
ncbi:hypothetical protein [Trinickia soli]|uniref:Uncharacterized protein n=1 Tax=Trinickia soli TaxID=380675 RepID=A0A2N7WDX5_9BURK|nr:hypothetical protein [Trinickia soli]KAA0084040.1 hypothetical protein CIW54_18095 [Paraburkholderia sp. T12-10]PMS27602.1 hypothetical protein C0Z19_02650 [Trinickia soli]